MTTEQIKNKTLFLLPTAGIVLFFILFAYSALIYPGGSQTNKESKGYSWQHNYWCELMNAKAMNGSPNPARPFAITGIICLAIGLSAFFTNLPDNCQTATVERMVLKICGISATICATLLFSQLHDLMLAGFSILTFFTLLTGLVILWNNHLMAFFSFGTILLLLIQVNNFVYYTRYMIEVLPQLQKITIILTLIWIMNMNLYFFVVGSGNVKD